MKPKEKLYEGDRVFYCQPDSSWYREQGEIVSIKSNNIQCRVLFDNEVACCHREWPVFLKDLDHIRNMKPELKVGDTVKCTKLYDTEYLCKLYLQEGTIVGCSPKKYRNMFRVRFYNEINLERFWWVHSHYLEKVKKIKKEFKANDRIPNTVFKSPKNNKLKLKFKVNDKVRYINKNNQNFPKLYNKQGKIVHILKEDSWVKVKFDNDPYENKACKGPWILSPFDLEKIENESEDNTGKSFKIGERVSTENRYGMDYDGTVIGTEPENNESYPYSVKIDNGGIWMCSPKELTKIRYSEIKCSKIKKTAFKEGDKVICIHKNEYGFHEPVIYNKKGIVIDVSTCPTHCEVKFNDETPSFKDLYKTRWVWKLSLEKIEKYTEEEEDGYVAPFEAERKVFEMIQRMEDEYNASSLALLKLQTDSKSLSIPERLSAIEQKIDTILEKI